MKKSIISLFLVAAVALPNLSAAAAETNLAPSASVTASKRGDDATSTPTAVNNGVITPDGNGAEKWFVSANVNGAWVQFKFDSPVTLGSAVVYSGGSTPGFPDIAEDFKFQYADGGTWRDVPGGAVSANEDAKCGVDFSVGVTSDTFRFVSAGDSRFRIREIELYPYSASGGGRVVVQPDDIVGTRYEKSVTKLLTLGMIKNDDERFYPEYPIKRGEFVSWIMTAVNAHDDSGERVFADVDPKSAEGAAIAAAYRMGIVSGDDDSRFRPNDEITYSEACSMLVSVLGYRAKALAYGGYPSGFAKAAASLKLDRGITMRRDGYLNRGDCALMIDNALDQKIAVPSSFGADAEYEYKDGGILEEYRHIKTMTAVIEANSQMSVVGGNIAGDGRVIADGEIYDTAHSGADGFVGCETDIYYEENDGKKTIVYAEPTERNAVTEVDARDIDKASLGSLTYYTGDRKTTETFPADARILLNGASSGINSATVKPKYGKYTLIDNDGDGKYEVILISSRVITTVKGVDTDKNIIYGDGVSQNLDSFENSAVYMNGKPSSISKISVGNIIAFEASANGELIRCYASNQKVKGKISALSDDKAEIDGREYDMLGECFDKFTLGSSGTFYLTDDGIIADCSFSNSDYGFGYIMAIKQQANFDNMQIKVLCQDGKINIYDVPDKIRVNGTEKPDASLRQGMVIKFRADDDKAITGIFAETESNGAEYKENYDNSIVRFNDMNNCYFNNGMLLGGRNKASVILNADTVVFDVPKDSEVADDGDYSVSIGISAITSGKYNDTFGIYNLDEENIPEVICHTYTDKIPKMPASTETAVVKNITAAIGNDGMPTKAFDVYINGSESKYKMCDDSVYHNEYNSFVDNKLSYTSVKLADLKKGDVIQIKADADNNILSYRVLYRAADLSVTGLLQYTGAEGNQGTYYPPLETVSGTVYAIGKNSVTFAADGDRYNYKLTACNVYICNSARDTVYKSDIAALSSERAGGIGARVFARINSKSVKDIVIYE